MSAVVRPVPPPQIDAIVAWFAALDGRDLANALLGAATLAIAGVVLCVGLMAVLAAAGRRSRG